MTPMLEDWRMSLRLMRPSEALQRAKCGLMIITRRVLASPYGKEEIQRMLERFTSSGALVPVLLDRGEIDPALLGPLQKHQFADFSEFSFIGEGFSKTERYVVFQQNVQRVASDLASAIQRSDVPTT
jgi:hypothetical protein